MRFIVFRKWCPENRDKVRARGREWVKELKQNPEKYLRPMCLQDGTIIAFNMIGKHKGFSLVEIDNEEQMQNIRTFWASLMTFTFVPIRQSAAVKQL